MIRLVYILITISSFALAFESTYGSVGYYRVQTSLQDSKEDVCFKAFQAGSKYRLGNECETWVELAVYQEMKFDNGVKFHNQVRTTYVGANEEEVEFLHFEEIYSEVSGLFDNSATLWVGRRYNERYDSFLPDYWLVFMAGDGFGVNNLDIGYLNLSYNYIYDKIDPKSISGTQYTLHQSHDIRLSKNTQRGKTTLFINYVSLEEKIFNNAQTIEASDGYMIGLINKDKKISSELFDMNGENISAVFYGKGMAKGAGGQGFFQDGFGENIVIDMLDKNSTVKNSKTFRIINYNAFENNSFGLMSSVLFEYKDDKELNGKKHNWYSAGVRPYWFLHKNIRVALEAGYDRVDDKISSESYSLLKSTIAVEAARKKGVWERPLVRLYLTAAKWSDNSIGKTGGSYYTDSTSGYNIGVQVEEWW